MKYEDPSFFGADHADSSQLFTIVKQPLHSRQVKSKLFANLLRDYTVNS